MPLGSPGQTRGLPRITLKSETKLERVEPLSVASTARAHGERSLVRVKHVGETHVVIHLRSRTFGDSMEGTTCTRHFAKVLSLLFGHLHGTTQYTCDYFAVLAMAPKCCEVTAGQGE